MSRPKLPFSYVPIYLLVIILGIETINLLIPIKKKSMYPEYVIQAKAFTEERKGASPWERTRAPSKLFFDISKPQLCFTPWLGHTAYMTYKRSVSAEIVSNEP